MDDEKPVKLAYICCKPEVEREGLSPIILHHGMLSCKERWKPMMQNLANKTKRKVYAVDARNHGESEKSEIFNFRILSKDLEHFMDTMDIAKAALIGHSMGGITVMRMALTKPDRVEQVVVEDMSPKELVPEVLYLLGSMVKEQLRCMERVSPNDTEANIQQQLRECLYRTIPMLPDEDREAIQNAQFPIRKTDKGFEYRTNLKVIAKAMEDIEAVKVTQSGIFEGGAFFIYGEKSVVGVADDQDLILKLFPSATFCGVPNAGHEVCAYAPDDFLDKILPFLEQ